MCCYTIVNNKSFKGENFVPNSLLISWLEPYIATFSNYSLLEYHNKFFLRWRSPGSNGFEAFEM